jgi:hypothetical protein
MGSVFSFVIPAEAGIQFAKTFHIDGITHGLRFSPE